MKRGLLIVAALASILSLGVRAEEGEGYAGEWYAGGAAQLVLPQGGSRMRRLGGGAARVGRYFTESLALECEAAWMENSASLAARAVWHLHGWDEFYMLFGYERFDPFLSAGAKGWFHDGQVGPSAGVGAFYYLTDEWALRFDAEATLGLDTHVETVYSLSAGLQYFF